MRSFRTGAPARDPFQTRGLAVMREGTAGGAEGGRPVTEIGGRSLQKVLQEPSGAGTSGVPPRADRRRAGHRRRPLRRRRAPVGLRLMRDQRLICEVSGLKSPTASESISVPEGSVFEGRAAGVFAAKSGVELSNAHGRLRRATVYLSCSCGSQNFKCPRRASAGREGFCISGHFRAG